MLRRDCLPQCGTPEGVRFLGIQGLILGRRNILHTEGGLTRKGSAGVKTAGSKNQGEYDHPDDYTFRYGPFHHGSFRCFSRSRVGAVSVAAFIHPPWFISSYRQICSESDSFRGIPRTLESRQDRHRTYRAKLAKVTIRTWVFPGTLALLLSRFINTLQSRHGDEAALGSPPVHVHDVIPFTA